MLFFLSQNASTHALRCFLWHKSSCSVNYCIFQRAISRVFFSTTGNSCKVTHSALGVSWVPSFPVLYSLPPPSKGSSLIACCWIDGQDTQHCCPLANGSADHVAVPCLWLKKQEVWLQCTPLRQLCALQEGSWNI